MPKCTQNSVYSSLVQSVCLLVYCTSPILLLAVLLTLLKLFVRSFLLNIALSLLAVAFTVRGAQGYFKSLVPTDKQYLILYPVVLFYVFLASYVSMA